ncbi:MAG: methylmalonyl-CoA mutase family protein [Fidelibacterota bacterium]
MTEARKDPLIKLDKKFTLKDDFPVPTYEEWLSIVEPFLKGAPFEKKLCTPTYEGITLKPLYIRKDRDSIPSDMYPGGDNGLRGNTAAAYAGKPWIVNQELPFALAEDFNKALLNDLQKGQTGVTLKLDTATRLGQDADYAKTEDVGDEGLSISGLRSLERALNGIELPAVDLSLEGGFSALPFLALFKAYLDKKGVDPTTLKGSVNQDPFAFLAGKGFLPVNTDTVFDEIAETITWLDGTIPGLKGLGISTLPYHDAGANVVQELAWMLSTLVEWINRLEERDITPERIVRHLRITLGVGPFFFMEIAKFRAARLLVRRVLEVYGLKDAARQITWHARPSRTNQTRYDPYVNMLRTTTEAFSAILGGVDSLHTNAFHETAVDEPTAFARRVARNIQIILREECHLDRLIDPAGGSYFVEALTRQVAEEAWSSFQKTEEQGGLMKALESGWIHDEISAVRKAREKDYRKRKQVLVGINMYADIKQKKLDAVPVDQKAVQKTRAEYLKAFRVSLGQKENQAVMMHLEKLARNKQTLETAVQAVSAGATLGEISRSLRISAGKGLSISPLLPYRAAEIFEHFRDMGWQAEKTDRGRPKIILVNMGPPKQHKIRSEFSREFLGPGGFEILDTPSQSTPEEAARTAHESGAFAAVLCSTDESYPEIVPVFIKKLEDLDSPMKVIVAGRPRESMEMLEKAGVYCFLYLGADAVDMYGDLWKTAGGEDHA